MVHVRIHIRIDIRRPMADNRMIFVIIRQTWLQPIRLLEIQHQFNNNPLTESAIGFRD
jgi:hypothetical protein